MNPETKDNQFISVEEQEVLDSININKIILPVAIGIVVVLGLMWRQFDLEMLSKLTWSRTATLWVVAAVVVICLRHVAYMTRLRIMTDKEFTWKKCFELIFIWEFSSAVTPTSVGGSAVAMFVLAQEKLAAGKIATIIFYTIIFDTFFFILGLPVLLLIHGKFLISPGGVGGGALTTWFFIAYGIMITYGSLFFYGIIINTKHVQRILLWFCEFRLLRRFKNQAYQLTEDMVLTAKEIRSKPLSYHLGGFLSTAAAWSFRFITVMCLMLAFVPSLSNNFNLGEQFLIFGRLLVMYVVLALSPTPGGAGIAESAFGPFLNDFLPVAGIALIIALLWRVLTYYSYLIAGAIVIPNWIRGVLNRRKKKKASSESGN